MAQLSPFVSVLTPPAGGLVPPAQPVGSLGPMPTDGRPMSESEQRFEIVKADLHHKLIERLDIYRMLRVNPEGAKQQVRAGIDMLLSEIAGSLAMDERERLIKEIEDDIFGLGPLEPLLADPTVNDILVNNPKQVYVERNGKLQLTNIRFRDNGHMMNVIDRIVSRIGRRVDEACPMVDARLPDGSRVNAVIPPIALDGPMISIRKFRQDPMTMQHLVQFGSIPPRLATLLERVVHARLSAVVSGGTGAGKTTLLNAMSAFIPNTERIITIEDAAELRLQQRHVLRLEVRPPNIENKGEVTQRDLVRNALRMRPDRIIVGEVRGPEALDMLQAMNTGHEGSITTIHSNSPRDALSRMETMILMAGSNLTQRAMRQQISSAIDIVVQIQRFSDGVRRVVSVSEIVGMESDVITMQDLYLFRQTGLGPDGQVLGEQVFTGVRPTFADRLESMGMSVEGLFNERIEPTKAPLG